MALIKLNTRSLADDTVTTDKIDDTVNLGRRNLIINGAMQVAQRGTSNASVTDYKFVTDRFLLRTSNSGWYSAEQSSDAPSDFSHSLKITSLGSNTPASGAYIFLSQKIEGYNSAHLNYGTSDAKTITISFYARSSITGTHGGALRNNAQNRSYPFTYTISSADTWEYKTITISGDTTGTWVGSTNGNGLEVIWNLGSGSSSIGTSGSWAANGFIGATGEVNIVETNGATFYITGVQVEVGTVATPFEHRSFPEELAACQRYFEKSYNYSEAVGASGNYYRSGSTVYIGRSSTWGELENRDLRVSKRSAPSVTIYSPTDGTANAIFDYNDTTNRTVSAVSAGENTFYITSVSGDSGSDILFYMWTADSEI